MEKLPGAENVLKVMVGDMDALKDNSGLDKLEIIRLSKIIASCRAYIKDFAAYPNYREMEERLMELEAKYAGLVKRKKPCSDTLRSAMVG